MPRVFLPALRPARGGAAVSVRLEPGGREMRPAHGRKLRAGRRAGWTGGKQMERPAHGQKLRAGRRAGRTGGKQMGASGARAKIACREARPGGWQAGESARRARAKIACRKAHGPNGRQADGSVRRARAKIARKEARVPGGRQADGSVRRARAKGPTLRHILFPASPHPLRGKARCGIVYSPETRHAATYAGCAPCRTAASAAMRQSPCPCGVRRLRGMSDFRRPPPAVARTHRRKHSPAPPQKRRTAGR